MRPETIRLSVLCVLGMVIGSLCAFYFVWRNSTEASPPSSEASMSSAITKELTNESVRLIEFPFLVEKIFSRRQAVHEFVGNLAEQELVPTLTSTVNSLEELDARQLQGLVELQRSLLERLSQTSPHEALTFALNNDLPRQMIELPGVRSIYDNSSFAPPPASKTQVSFIETVFNVWAANDLSTALDNAASLDDASREFAIAGILKTKSTASLEELKQIGMQLGSEQYGLDAYYDLINSEYLEDPRAVWKQIRPHLTFGNLSQDWLVKNVLLQWYEQEGLSIVDEVQTSDIPDRIKHDTSLLVLARAVKDSPISTFEYAVRLQVERPSHQPLVFGVLGAWADIDPQSAMEHLDELPDPFLLQMGTRIVVARWATQDPDYVLENLKDFPPDQRKEATSIALRVLAFSNPTKAAKRALNEFQNVSHNPALRSVMDVWVRADPTAAIVWVEQNGKNNWEKYVLAIALTDSLVSIESQRERAFDIARNAPDIDDWVDEEYVGLEADVITSIAEWGSLDTALKLLPEVRPGTTRAIATAGIASVLIEENRTSEAFNLGLELPLDDQFKFFPEIAHSWARHDPDGLMGSIDDIADEKLRSIFALQALSGYTSDSFTDEQFETLQQYLDESDRTVFEESQR